MAAPSSVFTISRVAAMLGKDEDWLQDIASKMEPEDGCLIVWEPVISRPRPLPAKVWNTSNGSSKIAEPRNDPHAIHHPAVLTGCVRRNRPDAALAAQSWKTLQTGSAKTFVRLTMRPVSGMSYGSGCSCRSRCRHGEPGFCQTGTERISCRAKDNWDCVRLQFTTEPEE